MTLQDKIKKCLPEEWVKPIQTEADKITPKVEKEYKLWLEFIDGFNACKIETCECSIPKILQVIREEVEKKKRMGILSIEDYIYVGMFMRDCNQRTGYNQALDDILQILQ